MNKDLNESFAETCNQCAPFIKENISLKSEIESLRKAMLEIAISSAKVDSINRGLQRRLDVALRDRPEDV